MVKLATLTAPPSLADVTGRIAGRRTQLTALAFVIAACGAAFASAVIGERPGPVVVAFVPSVAALWAGAELITAYLLITQFTVNGARTFLTLGVAYTASGLLAIPYIAAFPAGGPSPPSLGMQQVSIALWTIWHLAFPAIVALGLAVGRGGRSFDQAAIRRDTFAVLGAVFIACVAVTECVVVYRDHLPLLVVQGRLTPLFVSVFAPLIALSNAAVAVLVLRSGVRLHALNVWLAVALAAAALDGGLNALAGARYSLSWYVGKSLALVTASVVLIALLGEVSALYRRVGALAMNDALTGLRNRRSFDDSAVWALDLLRRQHAGASMLMIDIDFFKAFNDRYGHAAGDECLRRVGAVLSATVRRGSDMIARYGGEEFVALLPQATRAGALEIAESLRAAVEALGIPHSAGGPSGVVTISVGVGYTREVVPSDPANLLAVADLALYAAKRRRNATVAESREAS